MDTTYFGRGFGVMLFKDASSGVNLYKDYVKTETNQQYAQGVAYLLKQGFTVLAIVCDGRRGLLQLFPTIPVQMCNFHQVAIIRDHFQKLGSKLKFNFFAKKKTYRNARQKATITTVSLRANKLFQYILF